MAKNKYIKSTNGTKYVKDKAGKFAGSIGAGKNQVPTAAPVLKTTKVSLQYDPAVEVARFEVALSSGKGLIAEWRRNVARRQLELRFGKIDWSAVPTAA
jgi:hypothetical protein